MRALGIDSPQRLIERLIEDHISSSDETIFAELFFRPIAKSVSNSDPSEMTGIDFWLDRKTGYTAVKVVSGPNVLNSSQLRKQEDDFTLVCKQAAEAGHRDVNAMLGHCYGKNQSELRQGKSFYDRSGQAFWQELTGDDQFYQKLMSIMGDELTRHNDRFEKEKDLITKLFVSEFQYEFCDSEFSIDWERLTDFVSRSDG